MFGHGLFLHSVLAMAEQDITKHESAGVAPGPGPYERRESLQGSGQGDQAQQPWRQFSRNRNGGRGRGRGVNPHFSRSRGNKSYK